MLSVQRCCISAQATLVNDTSARPCRAPAGGAGEVAFHDDTGFAGAWARLHVHRCRGVHHALLLLDRQGASLVDARHAVLSASAIHRIAS